MATSAGIAAKELGDTRYYVAFAKLNDGTYAYSGVYDYSPKKYSMNMLGKSSTSEKQKALCVAMLNYGAAAQTYFNYRSDDLMNADLTAAQRAMVVEYSSDLLKGAIAADSSKVGSLTATSSGFSKKSATVSFEGAFAINYYFTPNQTVSGDITFYYWTAEDYAATTKLTTSNATGSMKMVKGDDGRYWAQVSGIAAKEIDKTFYVYAAYNGGWLSTYRTGIVAYSLSKYCINNASSSDAGMAELAKATAVYGYHAETYFAN
jgi:hypothetical protein